MKKHRLMIITHNLEIGGLQQVIVNLCKTLNRDLFDVSVLCLRKKGALARTIEEIGIRVLAVPKKRNRVDYLSFLKVAKILRQYRIEIIHTHNTEPLIDGTIAALFSGVKTVIHSDHARHFPDKLRYMIAEWFLSNFVYKVVGVSDHTSKNLIKYEKISTRKIITIPNGIDGERFNISINKDAMRNALGLPKKGSIIGLCVRLNKEKGITYLLQAMPKVLKAFPDLTLLIVGSGPLEETLKEEANTLNISDHIRFTGSRLDIPSILKLLDLYVLPSIREGLPLVILEAMAAGCPILATDVGGVATAISNGINGSLVKAMDSKALADDIIRLMSDSNLRKQFMINGLKRFRTEFNADIMSRKYEKLYLREL